MFFFINQVFVRAAFVCITFSLAGASDENDHSRFAYDHEMLDKIVQLEQKVEQMDKKLEASLESFLAILQYRKDEMQDSLTGNLTELKKEIQELIRVPKIAFGATNPSSYSYRTNQTLIFRNTSLNEGSGYDGTTGEFTAPVSGLYLLSAHICSRAQGGALFAIVVGSEEVANSVQYDHVGFSCSSVSTVTNIQKGEKVYLKSTSHQTTIYTDQYRQSSFTGVRLSN